MRLHAFTLDERQAMALRQQGWKFKALTGSEWELFWPSDAKGWPERPVAETEK